MRTFKPALSGRGVLAAAIALLSGQALAETAGRVTFVNGEVTASSADGRTRALQRGDAINGGDRISTRAGRLQIRFTDGGFISLQPNSVFGVDEYLYANRKPEETSLFFSLLQGGMRTVTGVIGKVNKQSYKVRTPVATIGIRGTEYLASVNDDGLTVSVGAGFVYVENAAGHVTGGAGQNISVPGKDSAPGLGEDKADVQASSVNGDREEAADEDDSQDNTDTVVVGNVQDASGGYVFLSAFNPFPNGPGYSIAYLNASGPTTMAGYETPSDNSLHATFDAQGSLQSAVQASGGTIPMFDRGSAQDAGSDYVGDLKWGAWRAPLVDGVPVTDALMGGSPLTLQPGEYAHYIIGRMTPLNDFLSIPYGGSAKYTVQGGTLATASDGVTGIIKAGSFINVTFWTNPSLDFNIGVSMNDGVNYTLTGSTTANVTVFPASPSGPASVSGIPNFSTTSSCSTSAGGSGCTASISGFFAGAQAKQIGVAYAIDDFVRVTKGTGAFGRGAINTSSPAF